MESIKRLLGQLIRFSLVGALNTLLDFGVFSLLTLIVFFSKNPVSAHVISYSCGVICSLFLNKRWTFKQSERLTGGQFTVFIIVNLAALGVSSGVIYLVERLWLLAPIVAKVISLPFSVGVNFLGNRLFVFRGQGD